MKVRVKVCGITSVRDALLAAECGAGAIGMVFAESPRRIASDTAIEITAALPPFVMAVGVFVDETIENVRATVERVGLHAVQLSGRESPGYVEKLRPIDVIKCVHVASREDLERAAAYRRAHILLDTASPRAAGGTGEVFDWTHAAGLAAERRIILAGGLRAENVAEAIATVKPWAVDVSSGVEAAPGVKDADKVRRFIENARRARHAQAQG